MLTSYPVIVIGTSAGGVAQLMTLLDGLPADLGASIVVATHRNPDRPSALRRVLSRNTDLRVFEPVDGQELDCAAVYIGPPSSQISIGPNELQLEDLRSRFAQRRRIDELFLSAAEAVGPAAIGVVMTGMLHDGTEGLAAIQRAGGYCIVQDPADADFPSMPQSALDHIQPDFVGTTEQIAQHLIKIIPEKCASVESEQDGS